MVQLIFTVSGGNVAGNANYTYVWSTTDGSGLIQGEEDQSGLGPGTHGFCHR